MYPENNFQHITLSLSYLINQQKKETFSICSNSLIKSSMQQLVPSSTISRCAHHRSHSDNLFPRWYRELLNLFEEIITQKPTPSSPTPILIQTYSSAHLYTRKLTVSMNHASRYTDTPLISDDEATLLPLFPRHWNEARTRRSGTASITLSPPSLLPPRVFHVSECDDINIFNGVPGEGRRGWRNPTALKSARGNPLEENE